MANAGGGVIIYGIAEYGDRARQHRPERIDQIDFTLYSKEWLEQVIDSNVRPRIDGIRIYPIHIPAAVNGCVYVVVIPQGSTAHQAPDKRYYKRHNFLATPMEDYEIRDVMHRNSHPRFDPEFYWSRSDYPSTYTDMTPRRRVIWRNPLLCIAWRNRGSVMGRYLAFRLYIPEWLYLQLDRGAARSIIRKKIKAEQVYCLLDTSNTITDRDDEGDIVGQLRYVPIHPGLEWTDRHGFGDELVRDTVTSSDDELHWEAYADNAPRRSGTIALRDIRWIHELDNPSEEMLYQPDMEIEAGDSTCNHAGTVSKHERALSYIATCESCGRKTTGADVEGAFALMVGDRIGDFSLSKNSIYDLTTSGGVFSVSFNHM